MSNPTSLPPSDNPKESNTSSLSPSEIQDCPHEDYWKYPEIQFITNIDDLLAEHARLKEMYCAAPIAQRIRAFIKGRPWNITNAVVLGLRNFTHRWHRKDIEKSMYQLIMFMDVVESLPNSQNIEIYAQDPVFDDLDTQFLTLIGVKVVAMKPQDLESGGGPAIDLLGRHTFLFYRNCFHPSIFLREHVELLIGRITEAQIQHMKWPESDLRERNLWPEESMSEFQKKAIDQGRQAAPVMEKFLKERTITRLTDKDSFAPLPMFVRDVFAYFID